MNIDFVSFLEQYAFTIPGHSTQRTLVQLLLNQGHLEYCWNVPSTS
jgi:hypothetical protein